MSDRRAPDERRRSVRQSRVVLAPVAGVKSAEAQHTQPGLLRCQFADDGDKTNSSPGRARNKPLKPLRREGRMFSAEPVCSCADLFRAFLHMRPRVQRAPGLPCALCFREGRMMDMTRADGVARMRTHAQSSSSAKADDPVFQSVSDGIEKLQRTGYSAFAEYDGV